MDGFKIPKPRKTPDSHPPQFTYQAPPAQQYNPDQYTEMSQSKQPEIALRELPAIEEPVNQPPRRSRRHWWWVLAIIALLGGLIGLGFIWYQSQLAAVDPSATQEVDVTILSNTTYGFAAQSLKSKNLIRSEEAMLVYGYLSGKTSSLKEGTCRVKASQTTSEIVDILTKGCNEFKSITFFPGATIEKPLYKPDFAELDQTMNVKSVLSKAGYSDQEISSALQKNYSSPLFSGKPASSSLEGYIYGETYHVEPNATVEQILEVSFAEMYKAVQQYDLKNKYSSQGLSLFEGITLASIVQRELNCEGKPTEERKQRCYGYQQQIAQVFLKRLDEKVSLGADATFIYAADMMKVTPRVDLDSPYNTRKYPGLPPGPIGAPGIHALRSVAYPATTDYNFYITGDDGLFYFSKTLAEHEKNIRDHCQKLCAEL